MMCAPTDPKNQNPEANWEACAYFIHEFVKIRDEGTHGFVNFKLWPRRKCPLDNSNEECLSQWDALKLLFCNGRVAILKSRQLGLTWLCLAIILWHVIHIPTTSVLLFSLRETEARDLLERLKDMYKNLPWFFKNKVTPRPDRNNISHWEFTNHTVVRAFSTDSGDSYQGSIVLIDEATLVPNLHKLIDRIEPVMANVPTGQFWLVSRANKDDPESVFNSITLNGVELLRKGKYRWTQWVSLFLSWWLAPHRTKDWYLTELDKADRVIGHRDGVYAMYPNNVSEALAPSEGNKRLAHKWVDAAFYKMPLINDHPFSFPDLRVYRKPEEGMRYFCGIDPAEGLVSSDDSAGVFVDEHGRECAILAGKIPPREMAIWCYEIAQWYNGAPIMCERMNHGHAVIQELDNLRAWILDGHDERPGWLSSTQGKIQMYNHAANVVHDCFLLKLSGEDLKELGFKNHYRRKQDGESEEEFDNKYTNLIHSEDLALQLKMVERLTLRAPEGQNEDKADAWALAMAARVCDYPVGLERTGYYMI